MDALNAHNKELEAMTKKPSQPPKLILIACFSPENQLYIWDGHHRVIAIYLGGRSEIYPEEYCILNITFELTKKVNFETGYVTPFDPQTEIRLAEFGLFKQQVHDMLHVEKNQKRKLLNIFYNHEKNMLKKGIIQQ